MKEILSITVQNENGFSKIERYRQLSSGGQVDNGVIENITKPGEMGLVDWYKHGRFEYNGKYITKIEYNEN